MNTYKQIEFAWDMIDDAEKAWENMQNCMQQKRYEQAQIHIDQGLRCINEAEESLNNSEKDDPFLKNVISTYQKTFARHLTYTEKMLSDPTIVKRACKKLREDLRNAPEDSQWNFSLVTAHGQPKKATLFAEFIYGNSKDCPPRLHCTLHYTTRGVRIHKIMLVNGEISWEDRWVFHMPETVEKVEKMVLKQLKHALATATAFPTKLGDF